ncbi:MAG: RdgB/HAM1 family non-canonical purine NTP pyrophosphatase [Candidatus Marinimicrobia bacterium]|nr:RdgB/HAM1 family non-canonical purine NTP pyrophosphatase [Candidatus Neomarinimicrobiota bacterium]
MKKIVFASHNKDKIRELSAKLGSEFELITLHELPDMPDVIEDGETLEENALKKSREIFEFSGLPCLADDTGLEVRALDGAPGVYSARYAGENVTYDDNVNKLLKEMKPIPREQRDALFRTVMAYTDKNGSLTAEGATAGLICEKKQGDSGFGYDPVFYVPEKNKTYSEMTLNEKNELSHRGKAVNNIISLLRNKGIL